MAFLGISVLLIIGFFQAKSLFTAKAYKDLIFYSLLLILVAGYSALLALQVQVPNPTKVISAVVKSVSTTRFDFHK